LDFYASLHQSVDSWATKGWQFYPCALLRQASRFTGHSWRAGWLAIDNWGRVSNALFFGKLRHKAGREASIFQIIQYSFGVRIGPNGSVSGGAARGCAGGRQKGCARNSDSQSHIA